MNFNSLIGLAESIAAENSADMQHQIVAFAVRGGAILAHGVNQLRYQRDTSVFRCSVHAEMNLLNKLRERATGCKIFVYRFNNTTSPTSREVKNAKPCLLCQHLLRQANISKVHYMNDEGIVETMRRSELAELIADPSVLTEHFIRKMNYQKSNGNFKPNNYRVAS